MAESIKDVMTTDPQTVDSGIPLAEAARTMKELDVGALIVTEHGAVTGIVTDRDIVIRGVAEGADIETAPVGSVGSGELTALGPDDSVDDAVRTMREQDIRRLPVVEDGRAVGIVSLGDLAVERDPDSALADISAAPPNE